MRNVRYLTWRLRFTNCKHGENEERRSENSWRDFEFKFGSTSLPFNDVKEVQNRCWIKPDLPISKGNLREKLIRKFWSNVLYVILFHRSSPFYAIINKEIHKFLKTLERYLNFLTIFLHISPILVYPLKIPLFLRARCLKIKSWRLSGWQK